MTPDEGPRPDFAEELLVRLERGPRGSALSPVVRGALAGAAVTASVALLVAGRRRAR